MKRLLLLGVVAGALVFMLPSAAAMPTAIVSFLGMGHSSNGSIITGDPPDPNGAVGPNDYVEVVNGGIEVFDKSGGDLKAATLLNNLWSGYVGTNAGNGCATHNDGDPIVRYDRLADRWLVTQFSLPNDTKDAGPSFQCVAVSKTGDPTGAYWLYDFEYPYAVNDYGKVGVWPDAYYATFNMFGASTYKGADICAWDRAAMLTGAAATQQCFLLPNPSTQPACPLTQNFVPFGILPANADGSLPPPAGSPEYLMQLDLSQCSGPYTQLDLWKLHVDWTTPANSALTGPTVLSVSGFTPPCDRPPSYPANCIPQPGSTTTIDGLDDRLMDRLVYRNYGTHESLFLNHTVQAGAGAGIRWYEIRSPGTTPTVFQQGTYAPADNNWRWMGSIAADQAGDIALGYSISAASGGVSHPSIAWTGRLAGDTLGQMGQAETVVRAGAGSAPDDYGTGRARWGDYSSMSVDPTDDCTFWYANEVEPVGATPGQWDTYIQSVKFPNCGQNDFAIAAPAGVSASQGSSGSTTVSTTLSKGTAESIQLTAFDLPTGATASFVPSTITAGSSSTLTLTAGAGTPPGTYTVEVAGTAPSAVHGAPVTFTVSPAVVTAPICTNGSASTAHNTAVAIVLSCSGNGAVTYSIVSPPAHGTLGAVGSSGGATYTPTAGFGGVDTFTFKATDSLGLASNIATANITVGPDHAPACSGQTVPVAHGTAKHVALGCSDVDPGNTLHWSVVTPPAHGTLSAIDGSGGLTYKPAAGFAGLDHFTFRATDNEGLSSPAATVSLNVAKGVPCSGLTGKKLRACKAKLKLKAALKHCAKIKSTTKRKACIAAAKRRYRRALRARAPQVRVSGNAPAGHRPPPLMVYQRPRRR